DTGLGLVDAERPAVAGDVPVQFVEVRKESDLPCGAVADHIFMGTGVEADLGAADPNPDAVADVLGDPVFRLTVAGDGSHLETDFDAAAVRPGVAGGEIPEDPAL